MDKIDESSETEAVELDDTEELVPKRGAVSVVWRFFGFKKSNVDQTTIFCKCCRAKVVAGGSNMRNLLHHLSRKHVLEYQECMKLRSVYSTSASNTGKAKEKSSQMKTRLPEGLPMTRKANGGSRLQTLSLST